MGILDSLRGMMRIEITAADIEAMLSMFNAAGILIQNVTRMDALVAEITVFRRDYPLLEKIAVRSGSQMKVLQKCGIYWSFVSLMKRPALLVGVLIYFFLVSYLPTRVYFVQVQGNQKVSELTIIEQAQQVGVGFGASRRAVRSERVKNALLSSIPQLQWVGVNTYGCVAVISVKERSEVVENQIADRVCSIVAKCDGIVDEIVANRGNVLCEVGQAVKENDILVSGYTDCGISIKATAADAEIYAKTTHALDLAVPLRYIQRHQVIGKQTNYSLIFGKNLIKLYKDSGISDRECVKMYVKKNLALPGGFVLPIALVKETTVYYEAEQENISEDMAYSLGCEYGQEYLKGSMIAGEIKSSLQTAQATENVLQFQGKYACREMIGKIYYEEIITEYEQRNGKNR